jgi:competence protein ComEC
LQDARALLSADYLKVAHHGSDTSSARAFIDAVRPSVAVISSGVRNRFDHPRQQTLDTFRARNVAVLRTDRLGSITWQSDGKAASLSTFSWAPPGQAVARFEKEIYGDR